MQACLNCQHASASAKFCNSCGRPLSQRAVALAATLPDAEEYSETLLFEGRTLRPEELKTLLQEAPAPKELKTLLHEAPAPTELALTLVTKDDPSDGGTLYDAASLNDPAPSEQPTNGELLGMNVAGYTIAQKLGEGGMGAVYQATHPKGKAIAIKVLHPEFTSDPVIVERFFNEAKAVNQIGHPHIIDISDFGYLPNRQPYIAMEFLTGRDLAARLESQRPLFEAEAIDLTMQVLDALSATHAAGVVHRDLKPENIFLLKSKQDPSRWFVKVLDFGIAKLSQSNTATRPGTVAGTILGTPPYMSPEQARGESEITFAADLYSLGVILYELLTGRTPFQEPSYLGYLVAHQRKTPTAPRELNATLSEATEQVVLRCLAKKPSERFASAKEMREALDRCLRSLPAANAAQTRLQTPTQSAVVVATKSPLAPPKNTPAALAVPEVSKALVASATEAESERAPHSLSRWLVPAAAILSVASAALYFVMHTGG